MAARSFVRLAACWALLAAGVLSPAGAAKADNLDIVPGYSAGFPESVKPAVEYAAGMWEGWITNTSSGGASTVELSFQWQSLGAGILGAAGVSWWGHAAGFAMTPAQYMFGTGIDSQGQDGVITFNSDQPWYAGTDGDPPPGEYDLVTVTLHEIGHQMGMFQSYRYLLLQGWGWGYREGLFGDWHLTRWDTYLRDQEGDAPAPRDTPEYFDETGDVILVSPTSALANEGNPVPIYSPDPYEAGSSLSHVFQPGDGDALMWPSIGSGTSRHGMYDYEAGIFTDLAWGFRRPSEVHATGVRDRRWHHGAAWAGGLVPADGAAVYLDAAVSSAYYVILRKDASAGSVSLSGPARLDIEAGALSVSGATSVQGGDAQIAIGPGAGLQTAELALEGGLVRVSAGMLDVGDLYVGHNGAGTLNIDDPAADITVSSRLSFGPGGALIAAGGAAVHMTGSALENQSADPAALAGLENLTLIFEGGTAAADDVEAAGQDIGAVPAGWEGNFALGTLTLGGVDVGRIRLVDEHDNQQDGPANDALYVHNLILSTGATIDLNSLKLYFLKGGQPERLFAGDANLTGDVDLMDLTILANNWQLSPRGWLEGDGNGDQFVGLQDLTLLAGNWSYGGGAPVPEPAGLLLLALGAAALIRREVSAMPGSPASAGTVSASRSSSSPLSRGGVRARRWSRGRA